MLENRFGETLRQLDKRTKLGPWLPDRELTLTRIPNSIITCRLCRGEGMIGSRSPFGKLDLIVCTLCHGTKLIQSGRYDDLPRNS